MATKWVSVLDIRLGALYRTAAKRGFDAPTIAKLLVDRCGFKEVAARQLAAHWVGTEPLRNRSS